MITAQQAYYMAVMSLPEANFDGNCVSYKNSWAFTYSLEGQDALSATTNRIYITKNSGRILRNDPLFDVVIWNSSENVGSQIRFDRPKKLQRFLDFIGEGGYLEHYGIKGMKWGVWNEETTARYNGTSKAMQFSGGGGALPEDEKYDGWEKDFPLKKTEMTQDEDMAIVNPLFKEAKEALEKDPSGESLPGFLDMDMYFNSALDIEGAIVNCATCSVIYDLRRRGYDVDATTTTNFAEVPLEQCYSGAKLHYTLSIAKLNEALEKEPDGARGIVGGTTVNGGGHAVAWEKENGQIVYRDCQTNEKYTKDNITDVFAGDGHSTLQYERLDDKPVKLSYIKQNAMAGKTGTSRTGRIMDALRSSRAYQRTEIEWANKQFDDVKKRNKVIAGINRKHARGRGKVVKLIQERTSKQ